MALRMMTSKENFEKFQATGTGNPIEQISFPGCKEPIFMETSHVGLVCSTHEHNYYDDSDFHAVVWNPGTASPEEITYSTTRGWCYPNSATVDATPEVKAAYEAFCKAERDAARAQAEADEAAAKAKRAAKWSKCPDTGATVVVANNRSPKAAKGETGKVFWKDWSRYDDDKVVVGVDFGNRKVFLSASCVKAA